MAQVEIADDGLSIAVDDGAQSARFHAVWLLDNATEARDPGNGQRLRSFAELPDWQDRQACQIQNATVSKTRLEIEIGEDARQLGFDLSWLFAHAYDAGTTATPGWVSKDITLWQSELTVPTGHYDAIQQNQSALRAWLSAVRRYGFAKLEGGPVRDRALLDIVDWFGYVRETNYGDVFDVRSEVNPVNLAYTGLGLQAHTDNPYRDPVPSLQILYCLENSASGGDSQVVDGFAAATRLQQDDPESFALLTRFPVRFTYEGGQGVHLSSQKPIIELGVDGELNAIHFNNRSIAPLTSVDFDVLPDFYRAIKALGALIDSPEFQVSFKLAPGESFIVDNQRVLHGRTGYDGSGSRWLQGCYPERDGLLSTLAVLNAKGGE